MASIGDMKPRHEDFGDDGGTADTPPVDTRTPIPVPRHTVEQFAGMQSLVLLGATSRQKAE